MTTGDDVLTGLELGRQKIEQLMFDAIVIRRNTGGNADDVLDESTGRLYRPSHDDPVVYGFASTGAAERSLGHESGLGGVAKLSTLTGATNAGTDTSDPDESVNRYKVGVPLDAPHIERNDWITVTYSERDPELLDAILIIDDVLAGTLKINRVLLATRYVPAVRS